MKKSLAVLALLVAFAIPASAQDLWQRTGDLRVPSSEAALVLLASGEVLVIGGWNGAPLARCEIWDPTTGLWRDTGSMEIPRGSGHTATLLPSGEVLVTGGFGAGTSDSAEIWDPATGTWELTGTMTEARYGHTATLLPSGEVLVAGGFRNFDSLASAEIWDPSSSSWTVTQPLQQSRGLHTATLLASGEVLLVGGKDVTELGVETYLSSVETFDPSSSIWTTVGGLNQARWRHSATLLPSGAVLVSGGQNDSEVLAGAEHWDPAAPSTWTSVGGLATARAAHASVLLPSGQVLVVGGAENDPPGLLGPPIASVEMWEPVSGSWSVVAALEEARKLASVVVLPSGRVLVVGGSGDESLASSELWAPAPIPWELSALSLSGRSGHTATALPSGEVLLVGGSGAQTSAVLWDPTNGSLTATGSLSFPRIDHLAILLPSGEVLVAGGEGRGGELELWNPVSGGWSSPGAIPLTPQAGTLLPSGSILFSDRSATGVWNPAANSWTASGFFQHSRTGYTTTLLPTGEVLLVGGFTTSFVYPAETELWDPTRGAWRIAGELATRRKDHSATLLPSGEVLVVGGRNRSGGTASTEIWEPLTQTWQSTANLAFGRSEHTATLLGAHDLLVTGGRTAAPGSSAARNDAEIWSPATRRWRPAGTLTEARLTHRAVLLPGGDAAVIGGRDSGSVVDSIERIRPRSTDRASALDIISATSPVGFGDLLTAEVDGLRADSEAASGNSLSASAQVPVMQLTEVDGSARHTLPYGALPNFWDQSAELVSSDLPSGLDPGWYWLDVTVAGLASEPVLIEFECGVAIVDHPQDATVELGGVAEFRVSAQGARSLQWLRDGIEIPGATGTSYFTPPVTAADAATRYSVRVSSGCASETSQEALLLIDESEPPTVSVRDPRGGEYWLLPNSGSSSTETVSWSMQDNVRICHVRVSLLFSEDGGATYSEAPASGGLPATFGPGGACPFPGESTTSLIFTMPSDPPSGNIGSLYKVEVQVTDHAGLTTVARSPNPFYIVRPNPSSVRTLILSNLPRMQQVMGLDGQQIALLDGKLEELADHPRVDGLVVRLENVTDLSDPAGGLYAAWDADTADADRANQVLFGCPVPLPDGCSAEKAGIQSVIAALLEVYGGVENVILVGDDRIIPMARLQDRTVLFLESNYPAGGDLTATGTTVGQALAEDYYLSDDPLAVLDPLRPDALSDSVHLPDLALGRLVEEAEEIVSSIATFISQDGVLDLSQLDPQSGHKVQIAGYDFLIDSARIVRERWKNALGLPLPHDPLAIAPVDGALIGPDWGQATVPLRRSLLRDHLSGNGGESYGVINLNGHATHYEAGVPGVDPFDIQGLSALDLYGEDLCGNLGLGAVGLTGSVLYSVGCHGGLPVAGSCAGGPEQSLDLPQTFLANGVMAYLANTGYGWGLLNGVGYSERLIQIFTEEMTRGGIVRIGELARRSKLRYFLESPRFDPYDEKTLMQWATYGFPMYAVVTGIDPAPAAGDRTSPGEPPPHLGQLPAAETVGGVGISRRFEASGSGGNPPFLTRASLTFDFSASGVYLKRNASGELLPAAPGCPAPAPGEPEGCYYTLNGLVDRGGGSSDLPILPYFIYDSRLAGNSQHGALWLGGTYEQEEGWTPVIGELTSNGGDGSNHGTSPRHIVLKPRPPRHLGGIDPTGCQPTDSEASSLLVTTAEVLKETDTSPTYSIHRLHRQVDLEIFYFNDTVTGAGNCDREGPTLGAPPFSEAYHQVLGASLEWAVPASDVGGVWRVVVVWNDGSVDAQGRGRWQPLELADDGSGTWRGSLPQIVSPEVVYLVQAVDRRGNVTWLDFEAAQLPASGVPLGIPDTVYANIQPGSADLAVQLSDHPDPVKAALPLVYTVQVENLGPEPATAVLVDFTLPPAAGFQLAGGDGWDCDELAGEVSCTLPVLPVGLAPPITILASAPATAGPHSATVQVDAFEPDPLTANNSASETSTVFISETDLTVSLVADPAVVAWGAPLTYTFVVTNLGPDAATAAEVSDIFPTELGVVSWSCAATAGSSCTPAGSGDLIDTVSLAPGGSAVYQASGTVAQGASSPLINIATVLPEADGYDPDLSTNSSSVTTVVRNVFADGFETGDLSRWMGAVSSRHPISEDSP